MHPGCQTMAPKRKLFIEHILPQLEPLKEVVEPEANGTTGQYYILLRTLMN